jgi:hypothetical protein
MVIGLPRGKVNQVPRAGEKSRETAALAIPPGSEPRRVHVRFIANLKLLFKF